MKTSEASLPDSKNTNGTIRSNDKSTESKTVSSAQTYGMLEIGMENNHSLRTWLEYFPNFFIYGIDVNYAEQGSRYKIFQADQSNLSQIRTIVDRNIHHQIAFIIDDGSHIPEHQLSCFNYLFTSLLIKGGIYIIEDIETSYWSNGKIYDYSTRYGYHHPHSLIEIFKLLLDEINNEFLPIKAKEIQNQSFHQKRIYISEETRSWISSITFGQNCIIITKKTSEEMAIYSNREYRFHQFLSTT